MSLYKRGGIWHYDFTVRGQRHRGSTKQKSKGVAKNIEAQLISAVIVKGGSLTPRKPPRLIEFAPKFFEWLDAVCSNGRRKPNTQRYYTNGWKRLKETGLPGMTLDQINACVVEELKLSGSPAYINQVVRTLRRILGKAEEWRVISKAPKLPLLQETGREDIIDEESERKLLAVSGKTLRDVILMIQDTGLRPAEIFTSRIEHINWSNRTYFNAAGKSRKSRRHVPISKRLLEALVVRAGGRTEGWLFPSARSKTGHIVTVAKAFRRACQKAGLPRSLVLYCGRHTFGTYAYKSTGNLAAVMDAMGHADVRTSMRYQHPGIEEIRAAIDQRNAESRHNLRHTAETFQ